MLGVDTLPSGKNVKITFDDREVEGKWDLMIKDSQGNGIEWKALSLTEISEVWLYYDNGRAWAEVK